MATTAPTLHLSRPGAVAVAFHRVGRAIAHAGNLATVALAAVLVLFISATVAGGLTRHHFEQVITGSMVPVIPVGSMVVTEQVAVSHLGVGDILVFPKPTNAHEVVVHRIVGLTTTKDGAIQVHTKGDANTAQDPWIIQQPHNGLADRAVFVVPSLGTAVMLGRNSLLILLPALLMVWLIAQARRRVLTIVRSEA
ncbi:MAG TPA: signal peptidase I [Candidatus Dormibacteraeota bacterium]|jgi:signal peptidase